MVSFQDLMYLQYIYLHHLFIFSIFNFQSSLFHFLIIIFHFQLLILKACYLKIHNWLLINHILHYFIFFNFPFQVLILFILIFLFLSLIRIFPRLNFLFKFFDFIISHLKYQL